MRNNLKQSLAILDQNRLQKDMLHHLLERQHYDLLFSCTTEGDLIKNSGYHHPDILLINGERNRHGIEECLAAFNTKKLPGTIVFYNTEDDAELSTKLLKKFKTRVYFSSEGFSRLISLLDTLLEPETPLLRDTPRNALIFSDNPFYKISDNKNYISILDMLKNGKSVKQIADILELSDHTVKTYIKKMRDLSGFTNTVQMVYKAREYGVI
ncbi:MAG: response regulator transcription factor [Bacteroidia bacterium]|nr:response regulator transcription factor [Bacteroidia bacterium]